MYILRRARKLKILFLHFMTILYNFALKTEISSAEKKVTKPILGTRNVNVVCMYIWFIHSWTEIFKKIQCIRKRINLNVHNLQ